MEFPIVHILSSRFLEHSILDKENLQVRHSDISAVESYECITHLQLLKKLVISDWYHDSLESLVKGFSMCFLRESLIIKRRLFRAGIKVVIFHQDGATSLTDPKGKWIELPSRYQTDKLWYIA